MGARRRAKFFQALGFELEFATDHASGQLRNGDGPYLFIAELPGDHEPGLRIVLKVPDADAFRPDPPVELVTPFEDTHYGTREAVVASLGVSMYLTKDANAATVRQLATLAPGSTLIMTFAPPLDQLDDQDRTARQLAEQGARASGTPWLSSFAPQEILALAGHAGFDHARHVTAAMLNDRYFAARPDDLRTSPGEELLVATT